MSNIHSAWREHAGADEDTSGEDGTAMPGHGITDRAPVERPDRHDDHHDEDRSEHSQRPEHDRTGNGTPQQTGLGRVLLTVHECQQRPPQRQARAHLDAVGRSHGRRVDEDRRGRQDQARQWPATWGAWPPTRPPVR